MSSNLYTDGSGRYNYDLVGGLDNGEHTLRITAEDDSGNRAVLNSSFTTAGQPQVTFTVTTGAGGTPTEGATVTIGGTGKSASTDSSGIAAIGLANGTYTYTVTKAGYRAETGEVTVYGDTTVPAVILTAVYDVTITVTMKDGITPVAGATITVTSGSSTVSTISTDADGKATISLENGNYSFTVSKDDYATSVAVPFTVDGAVLPGLTVSLKRIVSCTVTEGQVAIEFKPSAQLISSPLDRNVIVMYAIYEEGRMIGIATKTTLLTASGINDSAIITFNTKYEPDTCK